MLFIYLFVSNLAYHFREVIMVSKKMLTEEVILLFLNQEDKNDINGEWQTGGRSFELR